jgi:hypothetical protein
MARRAANAKGTSFSLFQWSQLALGMAEYRGGRFAEADEAFNHAMQAAPGQIAGITAGVYHVLSLHRQGHTAVARRRFAELEKQVTPLLGEQEDIHPQFRDDIILRLACKEARALLES